MTIEQFKERNGYEIEGMWLPRVTAIVAMGSFVGAGGNSFWSRTAFRNAAEWGTITHEAVGQIVCGRACKIAAHIAISIHAFRQWYKANPFGVASYETAVERRVFDPKNLYAGTIDMLANVAGEYGVIDVKTSTAIRKEHALQTAAYLNAYKQTAQGGAQYTKRWILRIDQYQECRGCFAKRREKYGRAMTSGGKQICNHQWSQARGEVEFKEHEKF